MAAAPASTMGGVLVLELRERARRRCWHGGHGRSLSALMPGCRQRHRSPGLPARARQSIANPKTADGRPSSVGGGECPPAPSSSASGRSSSAILCPSPHWGAIRGLPRDCRQGPRWLSRTAGPDTSRPAPGFCWERKSTAAAPAPKVTANRLAKFARSLQTGHRDPAGSKPGGRAAAVQAARQHRPDRARASADCAALNRPETRWL
jgi:hypothetical protein